MFLKSLRHFAQAIIAKQKLAWEKNGGSNEENDIHVRIFDKRQSSTRQISRSKIWLEQEEDCSIDRNLKVRIYIVICC